MSEVERIKKKIDRARQENKVDVLSQLHRKLAEHYSSHGRYADALQCYFDEREACEIGGDFEGVANSNRMIGEMHTELGQFETALEFIQKYLDYAKSTKDKVEEQRALATLGRTYFCWASELSTECGLNITLRNILKKCRKTYSKSLFICENELNFMPHRDKTEMKARLLFNLGLVEEIQEDVTEAQNYIARAISLCKQENLYEDLHRCYVAQGMLYMKQENASLALQSLDKAFEISNNGEKKVIALQHKAEVYLSMNSFISAKSTLKKAYKLKTPNENDRLYIEKLLKITAALISYEQKLLATPDDFKGRKCLYEKLGDGCCAVKSYKGGVQYYLKMLECAEKAGESGAELLPCYVSLAQTFKDDKQYDLALKYCEKELQCSTSPAEACKTYLNISEILEMKGENFIEITDKIERAIEKSKEAGDVKIQITAYKSLLTLQQNYDKLDLARETEKIVKTLKSELNWNSDDSDEEVEETPDLATDVNLEDILTDSEVENEEYDRPRKRQARSMFKIKRNEKGETQLHVAIIKGDLTRAKKLIEQGHPVKEQDLNGWTPLHEACNHGHVDMVRYLIDSGADINDPGGKGCKGITPLLDAASCGHFEIINVLLERGASITALSDDGDTALDCLQEWRKRVELEPEQNQQYQDLVQKMKSMLEAAGYMTSVKTKRKLQPTASMAKKPFNLRRADFKNDNWDNWISLSPELPSSTMKSTQHKQSATTEYQNAINMVRKSKDNKDSDVPEIIPDNSALLLEDDFVDDWLEDDMGIFEQKNKKRKFSEYFDTNIQNHETENQSSKSDDIVRTITKPTIKKQLKILPFVEATSPVPEVINLPETAEPVVDVPEPVPTQSEALPVKNQIISKVRIKIEEKVFLIPTPDSDATINWLCEELCKRYYKLEGLEPTVRLKTKDNAILSADDPLSLILNEELEAEIISWKSTSLVDRYRELCSESSSIPDQHLCHLLEQCRVNKNLCLDYLVLSATTLTPIFKCLKLETNLRELNLSGNILFDDGLIILCENLEKMKSISSLNLSCNNITDIGIDRLTELFKIKSQEFLNDFLALDLSFNPITDNAASNLKSIVNLVKNLESLNLTGCDFSSCHHFHKNCIM